MAPSNLVSIASGNALSFGRHKAITCTNDDFCQLDTEKQNLIIS